MRGYIILHKVKTWWNNIKLL